MTAIPEKLMDAALSLIAHRGFDGFSMKDLAGEAGVAVGSAYRHFADRDALLEAAYLRVLQGAGEAMFDDTPVQLDFAQYQRWWRRLWAYCMDNPTHVLSQYQFELRPHSPSDAMVAAKHEIFAPVAEFFERGRVAELWVDLPNEVLALMTFECLGRLAHKHLRGLALTDCMVDQACRSSFSALCATPSQELT